MPGGNVSDCEKNPETITHIPCVSEHGFNYREEQFMGRRRPLPARFPEEHREEGNGCERCCSGPLCIVWEIDVCERPVYVPYVKKGEGRRGVNYE